MLKDRVIQFHSKANSSILLDTIPGHFATSNSHVNYFTNVTALKIRSTEAATVAKTLTQRISNVSIIDTIVCVDGCETIGAYVAQELQRGNIHTTNRNKIVYVVTPEMDMNGQIIFRDNVSPAIKGKNIILLAATVTTGKTTQRYVDVIDYYGGNVQVIFALFSATKNVGGITLEPVFTLNDIPGYQSFEPHKCPMCKAGQKLEGLVNPYGISRL